MSSRKNIVVFSTTYTTFEFLPAAAGTEPLAFHSFSWDWAAHSECRSWYISQRQPYTTGRRPGNRRDSCGYHPFQQPLLGGLVPGEHSGLTDF